ncbi:MAG: CDP-diacylglycerol--glycerol-3-phosphate 3-phosphatidyltransferase [Endomicrobium sp.]|jgi:CDP-diacylglycerol--glycerol-3-phosphate 3-phosphatidyltransferase|nr:CDP-diacylglycerol--glycerol-3-phosphate 3-phosphatidyltransferase [Endomicrobium sp.]
MNLANKLTIIRICIIPFYVLFIELNTFYSNVFALILFCIASVTDFFDGHIARKNKITTSLGIFLDPIADKLLISAAFICFVGIPVLGIASWMVITIVSREILIVGLRSFAAYKNIIVPAEQLGKIKTTLQTIVIVIIMMVLILDIYLITPNNHKDIILVYILKKIPFWLTLFTTIFTFFSGISYILKYKKILQ